MFIGTQALQALRMETASVNGAHMQITPEQVRAVTVCCKTLDNGNMQLEPSIFA
jgi:hypothetical protein